MKSFNLMLFCFIIVFSIGLGGCEIDLRCIPDVPELTEQEDHLTYYFPEREAFGGLSDGMYTGSIRCGLDRGEVGIVVEDDMVTDCEIVSLLVSQQIYDEGPGEEIMENGCDLIIDAQSPQFDAVSGATGSSHALKICLTRALWEAAGEADPMAECVPLRCN